MAPIAITQAQENCLDLCFLERRSRTNRVLTGENETASQDENPSFPKALDLPAAADTVYNHFKLRQRSYLKGWMSHQLFKKELLSLRAFLLDPRLINIPQLRFAELLKAVNEFL